MALAWAIFFAYTLFAINNVKKAVIMWIPLHVFTNPLIALKFSQPGISLSIGITTMLCLVFFVKTFFSKTGNIEYNNGRYALKPVLFLMLFSYLISYIFSVVSVTAAFNRTIKYFMEGFIFLYVFHRCLNDKQDLRLFVKTTCIVVILVVVYGLYEFFSLDNPVLDFSYYSAPRSRYTYDRMHYFPGMHRIRYGLPRCYSFFPQHLAFGVGCVFFMLIFGTMFRRGVHLVKRRYILLCMSLLIIGVFAANSKQGLIGMAILMLCFYNPIKFLNKRLWVVLIPVALIWFYFPELFNNFFSLFDDELASEGGGSTINMRISQYRVALDMFEDSPLFGNGPGSLGYLKTTEFGFDAIRGAESVFLSLLPERGSIGLFVYLFMYAYLFFFYKDTMPKQILFFYLLTVFAIEVAGGRKDIMFYWGMLIATARYFALYGKKDEAEAAGTSNVLPTIKA